MQKVSTYLTVGHHHAYTREIGVFIPTWEYDYLAAWEVVYFQLLTVYMAHTE
jgi:hypothetical protein